MQHWNRYKFISLTSTCVGASLREKIFAVSMTKSNAVTAGTSVSTKLCYLNNCMGIFISADAFYAWKLKGQWDLTY